MGQRNAYMGYGRVAPPCGRAAAPVNYADCDNIFKSAESQVGGGIGRFAIEAAMDYDHTHDGQSDFRRTNNHSD